MVVKCGFKTKFKAFGAVKRAGIPDRNIKEIWRLNKNNWCVSFKRR